MRSLSASPRRSGLRAVDLGRIPSRLWGLLVTLAAIATAAAGGMVAAVSASLAMVAAVGVAGAAALIFASSSVSLLGLLVARSNTDAFSEQPIAAGMNAGSLIGIALVGSAGALLAARLYEKSLPVRGLPVTLIALAGIFYWFGIGYLRFGMDMTLIRELVRMTSIAAVGVIAANSDRRLNASKMGTIIVLAALIPAVLVLQEALLNWQQMVGGDLRPRGTMSHPNAAAILFGIAAPIAVWKAMYDRAGRRYLWAAGVFVIGVLLTRSMGGLAQLVMAMLTLGALSSGRSYFRVGVVGAVLIVVALFVFDPLGISRIDEFEGAVMAVQAEQGAVPENNSFEWRLVNWAMLLDRWQEAKLLGFGLGSTTDIITPLGHLPHSDPIRFLVETGALGAAFVGSVWAWVGLRLRRMSKEGPNATLALATLAVVAGVSTHALVTHVSYNTAPMYVLIALLAWLLSGASRDAAAEDAEREAARPAEPGMRTARRPQPPPAFNREG